DGSETYIAVACTPNPMRLRSTLAHELGHIRLETVVRGPGTTDWSTRTPEEREADSFARHLLIPIESVRNAAAGREATERLLS
ncbi:ImmA/IrrE family metallo-endopeptidase, partial [Lacticaseibacillus paracasei]